jgi:hypothetical protein
VATVAVVENCVGLVPLVNLGVLMSEIRQSIAIANSKQSAKNSVVLRPQDELVALAGSMGLRD